MSDCPWLRVSGAGGALRRWARYLAGRAKGKGKGKDREGTGGWASGQLYMNASRITACVQDYLRSFASELPSILFCFDLSLRSHRGESASARQPAASCLCGIHPTRRCCLPGTVLARGEVATGLASFCFQELACDVSSGQEMAGRRIRRRVENKRGGLPSHHHFQRWCLPFVVRTSLIGPIGPIFDTFVYAVCHQCAPIHAYPTRRARASPVLAALNAVS